MSSENFENLRQIVLGDASIQKELQKLTEREAFVCRLIEIGVRHGLPFSKEDVSQALRDNRRVWIERWI